MPQDKPTQRGMKSLEFFEPKSELRIKVRHIVTVFLKLNQIFTHSSPVWKFIFPNNKFQFEMLPIQKSKWNKK